MFFPRWYFLVFALLLLAAGVGAQDGIWVEYELTPFGSGGQLWKSGGTCSGFTYENSAKVAFFDINGSAWVEADLGTTQHWIDLEATGDVVMAVSDSFLVAFNAKTSSYHTTRYSGIPLETTTTDCWGCGPDFAVMVTDEKMYVFDAILDSWSEYDYGLPPDFTHAHDFVIGNNYVYVSLYRSYPNAPKGVVYSLRLHAFNQTDYAVAGGLARLHHGIAGTSFIGDFPRICGYSALTNQFDIVSIDPDYQSLSGYGPITPYDFTATTYSVTCRQPIDPDAAVFHLWGYDTRHGAWVHNPYGYNPETHGPGIASHVGGQFAVNIVVSNDLNVLSFIMFSGHDNYYLTFLSTDLYYSSVYTSFHSGGTVFVCVDGEHDLAWGYDVVNGLGQNQVLDGEATATIVGGENYLSFSRWSGGDPRMSLNFYHGPSNNWSSTDIWSDIVLYEYSGAHVYRHHEGEPGVNIEAVYYSPILDSFAYRTFLDTANYGGPCSDYLAVSWTDQGESVLFDANSGVLHDVGYEFNISASLGQHVSVGMDYAARTVYGYSDVSGQWSTQVLDGDPIIGFSSDYVGWASTQWSYPKYWAYNGLCGSWVELVPSGSHVGSDQGARTILVIRSDALYGFNPECALTAIHDEDDPTADGNTPPDAPQTYALYPNSPNPFNPATTIRFDLPRAGQVKVRIYDVSGRLVRTLVDEVLPAASHVQQWDGRDDAGQQVSSGTYLLRLETNAYVRAQKMLMVK